MGIRFEIHNAPEFARDLVGKVFGKKPLYLDGRCDAFFFGCPCGKEDNPGKPSFWINVVHHRRHLIQKIQEVYGVSLEYESLLNGAGCIGGLASHVEKLYQSSGPKREVEQKEKETARVQRLQDVADRLVRMGILRVMPSGDFPPDRADRIYREAEGERGLPGVHDPA